MTAAADFIAAKVRTLTTGDVVKVNKRTGLRVVQVGESSVWLSGPRGGLWSLVQNIASGRWYINAAGKHEEVLTVAV